MYSLIFSLATGHPTGTYYAELIRRTDGQIWDDDAGAMAAAPTFANTALEVDELNASGHFGFEIPADLPVGFYRASLRLKAGASPDPTDDVKDVCDFQYSGGDPVL